jgi:hypothetical protein
MGMAAYRITVRVGGKVERRWAERLPAALAELERRGRELERTSRARPAGGTLLRRFDPVQQVVGRIELAGPGRLHAGVDIRGDGSSEAFTGRVRRRLVRQEGDESPYDALRRILRTT